MGQTEAMNSSGISEKKFSEMTDLEVVMLFIDKCSQHINPRIFREINARGLYTIINFLPGDPVEAKPIAYARLGRYGKVFGDEDIDNIAGKIKRLEDLRNSLNREVITDVHRIKTTLETMHTLCDEISQYFR